MKLLRIAAWTVWFMLAWVSFAHAEPISALIAGVGAILKAGGIAATLLKLAFGIALKIGSSLIKSITGKSNQPGITSEVRIGGDHSAVFIIGTYAAAPTLYYINEYGQVGSTPNAGLAQVLVVSNLPVASISNTLWVNKQKCTRDPGATFPPNAHAYFGPGSLPIKEYAWAPTSNYVLFAKYYLGDQTAADPNLVSWFSNDPEDPWTANRIGRGTAYVVLTAEVKKELFSSIPQAVFEVQGLKLYDPRKDSSVGGSGPQRWGQEATYAFSDNPAVMVYNILRGIYYQGKRIYGPAISASRLPLANWFAAMNECDVEVVIATGTGGSPDVKEKQYRAGYEIKVREHQPIEVINELLKSCNGRMTEVGGIYKIHVGAPPLPVYFTDENNVVVTEEQEVDPFRGLEETFNGASSSYPDPETGWEMKEAPKALFPALEAEDQGQQRLAPLEFNAVPFPLQVQRLQQALVLDGRRFRRLTQTLPPSAYVLEPLDTISVTSVAEGFVSKLFWVDGIDDQPNVNQTVGSHETDPTDYVWRPSDKLPYAIVPVTPRWPAPQPLRDWSADGTIVTGANGAQQACGLLGWDGNQLDVVAVEWEVRRAIDLVAVHTGRTDRVAAGSAYISQNIFSSTGYQARGRYIPGTARETLWSDWMPFTTPAAPNTDIDYAGIIRRVQELENWAARGTREQLEDIRRNAVFDWEAIARNYTQAQIIRREITATDQAARASFREEIIAATGPTSSIAQQLIALDTRMGNAETGLAGVSGIVSVLTSRIDVIDGKMVVVSQRLDDYSARITTAEGQIAGQSSLILALQSQVTAVETTANGRNRVFRQPTAPTATAVGDLWIMTPDNVIFVATAVGAGGWVMSDDQRIPQLVTDVAAQSNFIAQLNSLVGDNAAGGLLRIFTSATPAGSESRIVLSVAASSATAAASAAAYLDARSDGTSEIALVASRLVVTDADGTLRRVPFVISGGVVYMNELVAQWGNISDAVIGNLRVTSAMIDNLAVTRIKIAPGAVTNTVKSTTHIDNRVDNVGWLTICEVTVDNVEAYPVFIQAHLSWTSGASPAYTNYFRIVKVGDEANQMNSEFFLVVDATKKRIFSETVFDVNPAVGPATYRIQSDRIIRTDPGVVQRLSLSATFNMV